MKTINERTRRIVIGVGIPAAVAGVGLGPYLANRSYLPERVASHFTASGGPDGSMTPQQFLLVFGVLVVLGLGGAWRSP